VSKIDLGTVGEDDKLTDQYYLAMMYFAQLVYFRWSFVEKSLTTLPGYVSHEIYDIDDSQAFLVEFKDNVFVSFRGTEAKYSDWRIILQFWQSRFEETKSHQGFKKALDSISAPIMKRLITARVAGKKVHFVGHSMGGALTTLMAIEHKPDTATVFGCPRILQGRHYKRYFLSFPFTRIENRWDPITVIPFTIKWLFEYEHVGRVIVYPSNFGFIKNHFIKEYIRAALDVYYASNAGFELDIFDPKELKKQVDKPSKR